MLTLDTLFKLCLEDETAAVQLKNGLKSPLVVASPFKRRIGEFISDYVDEYGTVPEEGDLSVFISSLESQKQKMGIKKALREIKQADASGYNPLFIADEAVETFRQKAAENAVEMLQADEVTPEVIRRYVEDIEAIEPVSLTGEADLRDVKAHLRPERQEERIKTGVSGLDQRVGGWGRGELIFVLADTGVGKSTALINFGYTAAFNGHSVMHITLELGQRQSALRFYRRVTERDRYDIRKNLEAAQREAERWWRFAEAGGEYRLFFRQPLTQTAEDIRGMVELFIKQHGGLDVLILDYLDLMSASNDEQQLRRYQQLGRISHKVRGLAQEHDLAVLSATQAKQPQGKEYEDLRLSDMGDAYNKARAADIVLGFVRTEEETAHHQGRYQLLKVREGGVGGEVNLIVELDRMLITDLDSADGRRVARELGMAPTPLDPEQR